MRASYKTQFGMGYRQPGKKNKWKPIWSANIVVGPLFVEIAYNLVARSTICAVFYFPAALSMQVVVVYKFLNFLVCFIGQFRAESR